MFIEARLILTKFFPRGVSKIKFGRYEISPSSLFSSTEVEAMLSFRNSAEKGHPEEEVDIVCKLLSVFLNARIRKMGTLADENNIPVFNGRERAQYPQFFGYLEPAAADELIHKVLSLEESRAKQFIRACRCYSYALESIPSDPAFAFFLFVSAGECMSGGNEFITAAEDRAGRFSNFIIKNLPEELKNGNGSSAEIFPELLNTAYQFHRDVFISGREEISAAAFEADRNTISHSTLTIEGKEIKVPGIAWLAKVVRGALIGYLNSPDRPAGSSANEELLSMIALEKAKLK